jgi:hypothetical protein
MRLKCTGTSRSPGSRQRNVEALFSSQLLASAGRHSLRYSSLSGFAFGCCSTRCSRRSKQPRQLGDVRHDPPCRVAGQTDSSPKRCDSNTKTLKSFRVASASATRNSPNWRQIWSKPHPMRLSLVLNCHCARFARPLAPLDCCPCVLETPSSCSWGVAVMTTTLVFSLIAALLMAGVIADSLWGRRFWR